MASLKMLSWILVAIALLGIADAQTQFLVATVTYSNPSSPSTSVITYQLTIQNVANVNFIRLASIDTNVAPSCDLTVDTSMPLVKKVEFTINAAGPANTITENGNTRNCFYETLGGGSFKVYIRGVNDAGTRTGTDEEYIITTSNSITNQNFPGSTSFADDQNIFNENPVTDTHTFTQTLEVVDKNGNNAAQLTLGDTAILRYSFTSSNHKDNVVFAGARLTDCYVSNNAGFATNTATDQKSVRFVNANGCFDDVPFNSLSLSTTEGFKRKAAFSTKSGTLKSYRAETDRFEVSSLDDETYENPNPLYIRCSVTPCYDDSSSTPNGQCGGDHCDTTARRRKRSVHGHSNTTFVSTRVNLARRDCCHHTTLFQGTVGALGTLAAILFGAMIFSYTDFLKAYRRKSQKASRNYPYSRGSSSSTPSDSIPKKGSIRTTSSRLSEKY